MVKPSMKKTLIMNKAFILIIKIILWILGISLSIVSIGGFASGDIVSASIVLIIGLLLIPPVGKITIGFLRGEFNFSISAMGFSGYYKELIKEVDLKNDTHLIQTIDSLVKSSPKTFNRRKLKETGKKIYQDVLLLALNNSSLSEKEKDKLSDIITYFGISQQEVVVIKKSLRTKAIEVVESLLRKSYNKEYSKVKFREEVKNLVDYFDLSASSIDQIRTKVIAGILQEAFSQKLIDKRLSPEEETDLKQMLKDMEIEKEQLINIVPEKALQELKYAKLLWYLENGIFHPIHNTPVTLQIDEECYLAFPSQLLEMEVIDRGYSFSGGEISIPFTQRMNLGIGSGRAQPLKEDVQMTYSGNLFLTSNRIIFLTSGNKSFQSSFRELLSFNVYSDGLEFILDRKNYLLKLSSGDIELFAAGLTSSIRNSLNSENEILIHARKTVESNESFIDIWKFS